MARPPFLHLSSTKKLHHYSTESWVTHSWGYAAVTKSCILSLLVEQPWCLYHPPMSLLTQTQEKRSTSVETFHKRWRSSGIPDVVQLQLRQASFSIPTLVGKPIKYIMESWTEGEQFGVPATVMYGVETRYYENHMVVTKVSNLQHCACELNVFLRASNAGLMGIWYLETWSVLLTRVQQHISWVTGISLWHIDMHTIVTVVI